MPREDEYMEDTMIEGQTSSRITNLRLVIACGLGFILALALSLASLYFIDILWQQKVLANDYGIAVTVGLPILLFFIIFKFIHHLISGLSIWNSLHLWMSRRNNKH